MKTNTTIVGGVTDLLMAINFYISTGDQLGEGIVVDAGDGIIVMILHDPLNAVDSDDFKRFSSRLAEVTTPHSIVEVSQRFGQFVAYQMRLQKSDIRDLTVQLLKSSGTAGFGSAAKKIEALGGGDVRERMLRRI